MRNGLLLATLLMVAGTVGAGLRLDALYRRFNGPAMDPDNGRISDPCQVKTAVDRDRRIAETLKKQNLFAPQPPKSHPVGQVSGILGQEVLIQGKWYKVGDKIQDAEITAVEPTLVRIVWDGNETRFKPIASGAGGGEGGQGGGEEEAPRPDGPPSDRRREPEAMPMRMPEGGFHRPPVSPEEMEKLRNMSPEERGVFMRERMQKRSP